MTDVEVSQLAEDMHGLRASLTAATWWVRGVLCGAGTSEQASAAAQVLRVFEEMGRAATAISAGLDQLRIESAERECSRKSKSD